MSSRKKYPYPYNMVCDACYVQEELGRIVEDGFNEDQLKGVEYVLDSIGGREAKMMRMHYRDNMTYQAIGDMNGLTRERIRTIIANGLRKLRSPLRWNYIKYGYEGMQEKLKAMDSAKEKKITRESTFYELDLSVRSYNCLRRSGIKTIGQLADMSREDLLKIRSLGVKSVDEICDVVGEFIAHESA